MLNISEANIRFCLDNLKVKVIRINYGVFYEPFPKHRHGNRFYEAHLVTGGSGILIADGKEYEIKSGILYMTGPLTEHEQITNPQDPMDEYCIQFELTQTKNKKSGEIAKILKDTTFWIGEDTQNLKQLFEILEEESKNKRVGYVQSVINLSYQILIYIARNYLGSERVGKYETLVPDDRRAVIADESFLYYYRTITLAQLSEKLNLSQRQTQRFLKKTYGKTFMQMKKEARENKAKELIKSGMKPSKASLEVGYENAKSLSIDKK